MTQRRMGAMLISVPGFHCQLTAGSVDIFTGAAAHEHRDICIPQPLHKLCSPSSFQRMELGCNSGGVRECNTMKRDDVELARNTLRELDE